MIHYFNPGHETAVLNSSKYYMAPANVVAMKQELSYLSAWYARPEDFVLVHQKPTDDFISSVKNFNLPEAFTTDDLSKDKDRYKKQEICLWGISPQSIYLFESLNAEYETEWIIPNFNERYKQLISRKTASECLKSLTENNDIFKFGGENLPVFFDSLDKIDEYINENNTVQFIAKAPYSSSGRGLLWLPTGKLTRTEKQILHGHLKKQGFVSLEKTLSKTLDFAAEFYVDKNIVKFGGYSLFQTNQKGAYLGNYIGSQKNIEQTVTKYISPDLLDTAKAKLSEFIGLNVSPYYTGYIGVDMMVYLENGKYKFHPCVEINLRNNMGIIALNISEKYVSENSEGYFHIDFNPKKGELYNRHTEWKRMYPAVFDGKKLRSGYLALCPVNETSRYTAYILTNEIR